LDVTVSETIRALANNPRTRHQVAVEGPNGADFEQLYHRAQAVGQALRDAGAVRGTTVAVFLQNSPQLLDVALGAMFCGAEFLSISSDLVLREVAATLSKVAVSVCVADDRSAPTVASVLSLLPSEPAVRLVETLGHRAPSDRTLTAELDDARRDDGAWIAMSGGTSGTPKLYHVSHEALVDNLLLNALEWGWRSCGTHVVIAPMAHGIGFHGMLGQLITGGPIAIAGPYNPADTVELIRKTEHAWTSVVPTILRDLALSAVDAGPCSSLSLVVCAGSRLSSATRELAATAFPAARIVEFYGSTEMGWVTWISPMEAVNYPGSVGRAVLGAEVAVLRDDGSRASPGESGTIWKRGRSYSSALIGLGDGPREPSWVTSHDIGYMDSEGYLYLQGRGDELIISGGMNVYADEVELILSQHGEVRDCVVVGSPDERWGEKVVAVVVVDGGASNEDRTRIERELTALARSMLASYKRPKRIVFSAAIPRTSAAKLSRAAVRDLVSALSAEGSAALD
jgi:acyl-CoA synthetase (AMP-forming)/AMP-acid ligase II